MNLAQGLEARPIIMSEQRRDTKDLSLEIRHGKGVQDWDNVIGRFVGKLWTRKVLHDIERTLMVQFAIWKLRDHLDYDLLLVADPDRVERVLGLAVGIREWCGLWTRLHTAVSQLSSYVAGSALRNSHDGNQPGR
jgi:hypothetical protein